MKDYAFPHLHLHTQHSLLDSPIKLDTLFAFAEKHGVKYLATTEHGNCDSIIKLTKGCLERNIHPIIGSELYIIHPGQEKTKGERKHLIVLVKEQKGFKNLMSMLTEGNINHFYYKPQIPLPFLYDHLDGLIVTSACSSGAASWPDGPEVCENLRDLKDEDFFMEVCPFEEKFFQQYYQRVLGISGKLGIPLVATNDVHYLLPEGEAVHQVLINIGAKKRFKDPNKREYTVKDLFYKSESQMEGSFRKQGLLSELQIREALTNAHVIAERCKFILKHVEPSLPIPSGARKEKDHQEYFKDLCWKGLEKRGLAKPKYKERLKYEIEQIIKSKRGFADYFLIVQDLQNWAKKEADIMTSPCRGSVGGSLVAYALGITEIDPLKYDLIFERFVSPGRIDYPDIDLDFEDGRRKEVQDYLARTYGDNQVAHVSTFGKMKAKGALRDVSRYFDVPLADVNIAAKSVLQRSGGDSRANFSLLDSTRTFERAKAFAAKYPEVIETAIALEGNLRNLGVHAAGIVLSPEDLKKSGRCYLRQTSKGLAVNWDDKDLEYMGFVKFDILGLSTLSTLAEMKKEVERKTEENFSFYDLSLDDEKVLRSLSNGDTVGIFQLGSLGIQKMIRELGIDSFDDIVAMNALYRPGALRTSTVDDFISRKHGKQEIKKINPIFDKLATSTHGLIIFQEQIMYLLNEMAGLPWKTADTIRKVISKSEGVEKFMSFQKQFVKGCVEKGTMGGREAEKMFGELKNFGSYGFNKSHACGYSMLAYYGAWCKTYYPLEFFTALMNHSSEEQIEEYVEDCRKRHIKVKLPSIQFSDRTWINDGRTLICGLSSVKGLSWLTIDKILKAKPFESFSEFQKQIGKLPRREMEALLAADVFRPWKTKDILAQLNGGSQMQLSFLGSGDRKDKFELAKVADDVLPFREKSDLSFRNRRLIALLNKNLKIEKIGDIDLSHSSKRYQFFCGRMRQIKYGYRDKIGKRKGMDSWGGVYGNFQDDTTFIMLVFNSALYQRKKSMIETLEGEDILVRANRALPKPNLFADNLWRLSDFRRGDFDDAEGLKLVKQRELKYDGHLESCQRCPLQASCSAPVGMELGRSNLMIVGEAPGREEDRQGRPFIGMAGQLLFRELKKLNFMRNDFYITNTVKCFPQEKPTLEQVETCSEHLVDEIRAVSPIVILSLGNFARYFFTKKKSGIVDANAGVEWSDEYRCWILYSVHPAMLLHQKGNERLLEESLGRFKDLVVRLL